MTTKDAHKELTLMIPIGIAAGALKTEEQIRKVVERLDPTICRYPTMGSFKLEKWPGNEGSRVFWSDDHNSINALGLPGPGIDSLESYMWELSEKSFNDGRHIRISVAGNSAADYVALAQKVGQYRFVRHIELNLGCPNVRTGGVQEQIIAFNPDLIGEIISKVWRAVATSGPEISVKLSPYTDPELIKKVAAVIAERHRYLHAIVTSNTIPNGYGYDERSEPLLDVNDGYGGLAGPALKHFALGQVRQFRKLLPPNIKIIGVGGISCGKDVKDMELAGADSVQIGTEFFKSEDPRVIQRIAQEYASLCD